MIHFQRLEFVPLVRLSVDMPDVLSPHELADDLALILREMRDDRVRARRTVSIVDLTGAPVLDAKQRAVVSDWLKDTRELSPRISFGSVFVAPSALLRGALTAIFWLQSFGVPHSVAANMNDAIDWALERLRVNGTSIEPGAQSAVRRAFESGAPRRAG